MHLGEGASFPGNIAFPQTMLGPFIETVLDSQVWIKVSTIASRSLFSANDLAISPVFVNQLFAIACWIDDQVAITVDRFPHPLARFVGLTGPARSKFCFVTLLIYYSCM